MECGAKTRSGAPCRSRAMANGRCRMHGGTARRGVSGTSFKHGGYSKYLPRSLGPAYDDVSHDEDLLNLTEGLRLVESRLRVVLQRADSGEAGHLWQEMRTAWREFKRAATEEEVRTTMARLDDLIARGSRDADVWQEVGHLLERRRKLTESETKRRVQMHAMVTTERLDLLMSHIVRAINENVQDADTRRKISDQLAAVIGEDQRALASSRN